MDKKVKIDTTQMDDKIKAIMHIIGHEQNAIVRQQAALLIQELVKVSLPKSVTRSRKNVDTTVSRAWFSSKRGPANVGASGKYAERYWKVRMGGKGKAIPLQQSAMKTFAKAHQELLGLLAAGWCAGAKKLGISLREIVKKQEVLGDYKERKTDKGGMVIEITNSVPYNYRAFKKYYPKMCQMVVAKRSRFLDAFLKKWQKGKSWSLKIPGKYRD